MLIYGGAVPLRSDDRGDPVQLVPPRYGSAGISDLLPSVLGALDVEGERDVLGLGHLRRVVVLVLDGLGARQLHRHGDAAPLLSSTSGRILDAAFPSTTATSLASLGTGRPPGEHGLVGYAVALADAEQPLNLLSWRIGLRGGGADALDDVVPEDFQPLPTALERATAAGVATTTVLRPEFPGSGLTRAALRGGEIVTADSLDETLRAAVAAASGPSGRSLVYAYHGEIDTAGHSYGPGSREWLEAVAAADACIADLATDLPPEVTLLITADHGMRLVPPEQVVEVKGRRGLEEGVRVLAGEPRVRHVHVEEGAGPGVLRRWRDFLDGHAAVLARDDAVARGLFGPHVNDRARRRIGDVVVIATQGSIVHEDVDPEAGRLLGQHGGLTPEEVEVPLLMLGAGART